MAGDQKQDKHHQASTLQQMLLIAVKGIIVTHPLLQPLKFQQSWLGNCSISRITVACMSCDQWNKFLLEGKDSKVILIVAHIDQVESDSKIDTETDDQPVEYIDSIEAGKFGEWLGEKSAEGWTDAQLGDKSARVVIDGIAVGFESWKYEELPGTANKTEIRRFVGQGGLILLPDPRKLLVRRLTKEPREIPDMNPGKYERLFVAEPRRTFVLTLTKPWGLDFALK